MAWPIGWDLRTGSGSDGYTGHFLLEMPWIAHQDLAD